MCGSVREGGEGFYHGVGCMFVPPTLPLSTAGDLEITLYTILLEQADDQWLKING